MTAQANRVVEIELRTGQTHARPTDLAVSAIVTGPGGGQMEVPAFWAGGGAWKIRYASDIPGVHRYRTVCAVDAELDGHTGAIEIERYGGDNPLYRHGAIGRRGDDLYLTHRDGTPFFWLGDTWWMGLTRRLSWDGFRELTDDRVRKGFGVVQIVAGLYPDMLPFDERGANEAGFPWDERFEEVNPAYFDEADRKITHLVERGIVPCVVGSWGFYMRFAGAAALRRHWGYLIARWAAYPVVWCLAGEANMAFYGDQSLPPDEHLKRSRREWNDMAAFVRAADPFHRLVTIHPTQNGHEQIEDESLLDLDMLQTGHGGCTSLVPTLRQVAAAVARRALPVINAEVCYEGNCGTSYADVQRFTFLTAMLQGACGHTYGANGIWQLNAVGAPYGVSPHGAHWGDTPWEEAYRLPGSFQVGAAKKLLDRFRWWEFAPHPEWVDRPCSGEALDGVFAAGIPGVVRVIYRPFFGGFSFELPIRGIERGVAYRAFHYNPITAEEFDLGAVQPDEAGDWVAPPVNAFQDWVTVLYAQ